jgi:hypothetical protein
MKYLIFLLFCCFQINHATGQSYWAGGTPGRENAWDEPNNWLLKRVPGPADEVVVPHLCCDYYPVISDNAGLVAKLEIEGGASLTILKGGKLTVGAGDLQPDVFLTGMLFNYGTLILSDASDKKVGGMEEHLVNEGKLVNR